jgi:predicted AlkP superfamily phosphohydrolase/phosphomutase
MTQPKSLLLGLDGATFTVLDPLMARGVMPFLRDFTARGVRGTLRSIMPPLTPPAWTSLMTGKRPGQHGVFDFFQKETPESQYLHFANSQDVRSATIWSLAGEYGQRVISLNFPLMFPSPAVNGYVVSGGWMPWRQLRLGCHPPGLFDRLKSLPSFNPRELALDMALEAKAIEGCDEGEYADWIDLHIRREQRWFDILRYLMQEEPADLIGVVFDGVDKLQHLCWRFLDPTCRSAQPSAWEREITARCEVYFRRLDQILADLVALAGPETRVVLASDHGFGPTSDVFYLNAWLEQQGYLAWANESEGVGGDAPPQIGFSEITRHVYQLDWDKTVACASTPSSQGIHIVRRPPNSAGEMPEERHRQIRAELIAALRAVRHPTTGEPLVTEICTREEAFAGPHEALAPDLSITLADGAAISILRSDVLTRRRPEPKGNHRPEGIFLAAGPGIRSGVAVEDLSIVDVAPLLLYCQGLPVPEDMSGRVPREIFVPAELEQRPPQSVAATNSRNGSPVAVSVAYDTEDEDAILKRLRALGYVE